MSSADLLSQLDEARQQYLAATNSLPTHTINIFENIIRQLASTLQSIPASSIDLSHRLDQAHQKYTALTNDVHEAALNAHNDITYKLKISLMSLFDVVAVVYASFTDENSLDESGLKTLRAMKDSFVSTEASASHRLKDLQVNHEKIVTLQNETIFPLKEELQELFDRSNKLASDAEIKSQELMQKVARGNEEMRKGQKAVDDAQDTIDSPVIEAAAVVGHGLFWLGGQVAKVFGDKQFDRTKGPLDLLKDAQNNLNNIRLRNAQLLRQSTEAKAEIFRLYLEASNAKTLIQEISPLIPRTKKLASISERFKAALIHTKAQATTLVKEASEVAGSASVTSSNTYTKEDFAFGILNICKSALFDIVVKDEIELIIAELVKSWTSNGKLTMQPRLKVKLEEVQKALKEFKQGDEEVTLDNILYNTYDSKELDA